MVPVVSVLDAIDALEPRTCFWRISVQKVLSISFSIKMDHKSMKMYENTGNILECDMLQIMFFNLHFSIAICVNINLNIH